jgi:catechol 2,3-dioxygenase-like lactoylglutathione lyase family enzyme
LQLAHLSTEDDMALRQLGHVAIRVEDIPKAVEFYQKLGMVNVWQDPDWAYMKAGEDGLALLGPGYRAAGPHFGFVFDSIEELQQEHQRLKSQGILVGEIHSHRDGTASFYGKDPDGNLFEFLYEPAGTFDRARSAQATA